MDKEILVSIITPCFNSEKTIKRTLECILNQTYQNYEYIIIDGASTDETLTIVQSYQVLFGDKIKIISEKDNGIYDAYNKGIRNSKGELIGIVNSDDYYEKNAIENMVSAYLKNGLEEKSAVLYGFERSTINDELAMIRFYHHNMIEKRMITFPTCFVTKVTYNMYGLYNEKYQSAADYDYMLQLFYNTNTFFVPVYKLISTHGIDGISHSMIGRKETAAVRCKYKIITKRRYYWIYLKCALRHLITFAFGKENIHHSVRK